MGAERKASRPGRRILSELDIEDALRWRLGGRTEAEIDKVAEWLRPFADDFSEEHPRATMILSRLHRAGDRRSPWSLACAVLADDAARRGDTRDYWRFGVEVVAAYRQAKRGAHNNHAKAEDALDRLIAEYLSLKPDDDADTLFKDFAAMAGGFHLVLADFDLDRDELVCELGPDDGRLTNVSRSEFARRVEKMRARVKGSFSG